MIHTNYEATAHTERGKVSRCLLKTSAVQHLVCIDFESILIISLKRVTGFGNGKVCESILKGGGYIFHLFNLIMLRGCKCFHKLGLPSKSSEGSLMELIIDCEWYVPIKMDMQSGAYFCVPQDHFLCKINVTNSSTSSNLFINIFPKVCILQIC